MYVRLEEGIACEVTGVNYGISKREDVRITTGPQETELFSKRGLTFRDGWAASSSGSGGTAPSAAGAGTGGVLLLVGWRGKGKSRLLLLSTATTLLLLLLLFILSLFREQCISRK